MEKQHTLRKFLVLSTTVHALYNTIFGVMNHSRDNFKKGIIGK